MDVKLINRGLWVFNVLLGLGIVAFSWQYLLRASTEKYLADFRRDDDAPAAPVRPRDESDGALRTLVNPVEKRQVAVNQAPESQLKATLKGTLPSDKDPKSGVAFIKSTARNLELVCYVNEEILQEGKPYDEFRGWTLQTVSKDRAVFATKGGQRAELTLDQAITPPPAGSSGPGLQLAPTRTPKIGQAYTGETYKSRLLASADSRQVWGMDQEELDWASQNADQIMDRDFQVSPYAGGGIRIENVTAGSIGAARGLSAGDVLREVNGQPLNSIADVRTLMGNPAMRQQAGLRLTIERAGKPLVIEYRPLPR